MPKRAIIVRHAESTSNANEPTEDFDAVALSERGRAQAEALAERFPFVPDMIAYSKFLRTHETARPLIRKNPNALTQVWDIYEFVPVPRETTAGKTMSQTQPLFDDYWRRGDPAHKSDRDTESFADVIGRVGATIRMIESASSENTAIFSHGRYIRILEAFVNHSESRADLRALMYFSGEMSEPVANTAMLEFQFAPDGKIFALHRLPLLP